MISKRCEECGVNFQPPNRRYRFCSRVCAGRNKRVRIKSATTTLSSSNQKWPRIVSAEGLKGWRVAHRRGVVGALPRQGKIGTRYRTQAEAGLCPHCGKPCQPYSECEVRRAYTREWRRTHPRSDIKKAKDQAAVRMWKEKNPIRARALHNAANRRYKKRMQVKRQLAREPQYINGGISTSCADYSTAKQEWERDLDCGNVRLATVEDQKQCNRRLDYQTLLGLLTPIQRSRVIQAVADDRLSDIRYITQILRRKILYTQVQTDNAKIEANAN